MIIGFFMYAMQREDIKAVPKAVQPEKAVAKLDLKAEKKQLIVSSDPLKGVRLGQGRININATAPVTEREPLDTLEQKTLEPKPLLSDNPYG